MSKSSKIIDILAEKSLAGLAPGLKQLFMERGRVELVEADKPLCAMGEPIHRLIIPLSDPLKLVAGEKVVGYLQKFRSLAFGQVLEGEPAPYTAVTEATTTIFSVPAQDVVRFLEGQPVLRHYLRLMSRSRAVRRLKEFLGERGIDPQVVIAAFQHVPLESEDHERGTLLDLEAPGLWLIERGAIRVATTADAREQFDATVAEGSWIGGEAAVPPGKCSYVATVAETAALRRVPLQALVDALASPAIVEALYAEPCIVRRKVREASGADAMTALPGERLAPAQILALRLAVGVDTLRFARTDAESVLASAVNLAALLGVPVNAASLETELEVAGRATPAVVACALERFGFVITQIKSSFANLRQQNLPALVTYGPRLVILASVAAGGVVLLDPCQGVCAVSKADFTGLWDGHILEAERSHVDLAMSLPDAKPGSVRVVVMAMLATMRELRVLLVNRGAFMLLGLLVGALTPLLSQYILDAALTMREMNTIAVLSLGSFLIAIFSAVMGMIGARNSSEFSARFDHRTQTLFYRQVLSARGATGGRDRIGDVMTRFGELGRAQGFLANTSFQIVSNILSTIIYSVFLLSYDWRLAATAFMVFPTIIAVRLATRARFRQNSERAFGVSKRLSSMTAEQISAMATIKAAAAEPAMRQKWEKTFVEGVTLRRQLGTESAAASSVIGLVTSLIQVSCLFFGLKLAASHEVSIGGVFAVNMYVGSLIGPVVSLAALFTDIEQVKISFRKVAEILTGEREELPSEALSRQAVRLSGKIKLDRVSYRYEADGPWVLRDVSLTIFPRQVVAIVGRSGCGKSTLAKLVAGNLAPTTGRLLFDDMDAGMISTSSLRQQIGVVLQENELFSGSILENVAYADDAPDKAQVDHATGQAGAAEFVDRLPAGLGYYLAEGGLGLSGGQRQRLTIARTLYRTPEILIFDEATSALDAESEAVITDKMKEILHGRTAIVIAHRLSTIRNADRIIVMADGQVIEEGTHASLMDKQGHYYELFRNQLVGAAA